MKNIIILSGIAFIVFFSSNTQKSEYTEIKKSKYKNGDFPLSALFIDNHERGIEASEYFEDTIIHRIFPTKDSAGSFYYSRGIIAMRNRNWRDAIKFFQNNYFFEYKLDLTFSNIAFCYFNSNEKDSALLYVQKALTENPDEQGALMLLEWIKNKNRDNVQVALEKIHFPQLPFFISFSQDDGIIEIKHVKRLA